MREGMRTAVGAGERGLCECRIVFLLSLVSPLSLPCLSLVSPLSLPCLSLVSPLSLPCLSLVSTCISLPSVFNPPPPPHPAPSPFLLPSNLHEKIGVLRNLDRGLRILVLIVRQQMAPLVLPPFGHARGITAKRTIVRSQSSSARRDPALNEAKRGFGRKVVLGVPLFQARGEERRDGSA